MQRRRSPFCLSWRELDLKNIFRAPFQSSPRPFSTAQKAHHDTEIAFFGVFNIFYPPR